jgi:hypothetical protein
VYFSGEIYIIGGYTNNNLATTTDEVDIFKPQSQIATNGVSMKHMRSNHAAVAVDSGCFMFVF